MKKFRVAEAIEGAWRCKDGMSAGRLERQAIRRPAEILEGYPRSESNRGFFAVRRGSGNNTQRQTARISIRRSSVGGFRHVWRIQTAKVPTLNNSSDALTPPRSPRKSSFLREKWTADFTDRRGG